MTLAVFKNGVLYADNRMVKEAGERDQFFYEGQKVWIDDKKRIAIAFVGDVPHESEVVLVMERMTQVARNFLLRDALPANEIEKRNKLEGAAARLMKDFPGMSDRNWMSIYAITNKHAWLVTPEDDQMVINIFFPGVVHCRGSGKRAFNMCDQAGLTPEEAYAVISSIDHSVGPLATKIAHSDLNEFEPEVVTAEEGEA